MRAVGASAQELYELVSGFEEFQGRVTVGGVAFAVLLMNMATPAIAEFGSEYLKETYLKPAIAGEVVASIAVTEPGAGSDLASVQTFAERKGDKWVINGHKVWTSLAHFAEWMIVLLRTEGEATYAAKLGPEDRRLDWDRPAEELDRWIRGCDPWPGAWTTHDDRPLQVFHPELGASPGDGPPGMVLCADSRDGLVIATGSGAIRIREVKPAGRPRLSSEAWIHGRGVSEGQSFE